MDRIETGWFRAACIASLAAAGCGPGELTELGVRRVTFDPVGSVADLRAVQPVVRTDPGDWERLVGEGGLEEDGFLFHGTGERRLSIPGPFDLDVVDRVDLHLETDGELRIQPAFVRDGRPEILLEVVRLADAGEHALAIPVPDHAGGVADELWLVFRGDATRLRVAGVDGIDCPQPFHVPPPDAGPVPVTLAGDTRHAVGLFPGKPLTADIEIRTGEHLSFALGYPGRRPVHGRVTLRVERDGDELFDEVSDARDGRAWTAARMNLSALAPGPAKLHFELEPVGGVPVAAALTMPVIYRPAPDPPSVFLITSDTHRGDYLGASGSGIEVDTPALDALAARGVLFEDCASTTNITTPSHVTLFTAVHPRDHGILDNETALAGHAPTLAEEFEKAGWATLAAVSASHLGPERSGLGQGFERYAAPEVSQRHAFDAIVQLDRWIDEMDDRPLFVWLHVFDAHAPYTPPPPWQMRYWSEPFDPRDQSLPVPERVPWWARGVRDLRYLECLYRGAISHLDERLEPLLAHPRLGSGWVAFTADHGEYLGVDDGWFNHLTLDVANLHVPMILAGPGVPARRVTAPVSHSDLGRTLLDLAGLGRAEFPGTNLLQEVSAGDSDAAARYAVARYGQSISVERDGWMLVRHIVDQSEHPAPMSFAAGQEQLFHVRVDPACAQDLVHDQKEHAARLGALLDAFQDQARALDWATERATSEAERRELDQLGYGGDSEE